MDNTKLIDNKETERVGVPVDARVIPDCEIKIGDKINIDTGNGYFSSMIVKYIPSGPGDCWIVYNEFHVMYIQNYQFIEKQIKDPGLPF